MSNASDQATFLDMLRRRAGSEMTGNTTFRRDALGWNETRYWRTHAALLATGSIVRGRGRGGSVGLAQAKRRAA